MDPITIAIIAAVGAGLAQGVQTVSGNVLVDAYNGLKGLLKRKFGGDSDVAKAVDAVETKPNSEGRKQTLQEEVVAAQADKDPEILQAAQALIEQIKAQPGGAAHIMNIQGNQNVGVQGNYNTTSVNMPKE